MSAADTKSKSESTDPMVEKLVEKAKALEKREHGLKLKEARKDKIFFGAFTVLYIVMAAVAIARRDLEDLLFILALWLWIPMMYLNNRIINNQRYTINMMTALRDLENEAIMERLKKED